MLRNPMGLVYVPQSAGKGATSGNIRNFSPRLAGSYSRIGTIIQGVRFGYRFVKSNYKLFTGIGAVATGAGVENLIGQSNNQFRETLRSKKRYSSSRASTQQLYNRRGHRRPSKSRRCSCGCCC